jgi:hypothetical protein
MRSDWHRHNLKRQLKGIGAITVEGFNALTRESQSSGGRAGWCRGAVGGADDGASVVEAQCGDGGEVGEDGKWRVLAMLCPLFSPCG